MEVEYEFKKLKSGYVVCFYRLNQEADKNAIQNERQKIIINYTRENGGGEFIGEGRRTQSEKIFIKGVKQILFSEYMIKSYPLRIPHTL